MNDSSDNVLWFFFLQQKASHSISLKNRLKESEADLI